MRHISSMAAEIKKRRRIMAKFIVLCAYATERSIDDDVSEHSQIDFVRKSNHNFITLWTGNERLRGGGFFVCIDAPTGRENDSRRRFSHIRKVILSG